MAIQTIYNITFEGLFLDSSGAQIPTGEGNAATFNSLDEVNLFIEASGSDGTYSVPTFIIKS
jgi:hypothetical protein